MTASLLEGLNPEQQRAVLHPGGPLLILAGAGTGKTRTITRRVAHLVQARGVAANAVLAITFTNKAARELRSRIAQWVPDTRMWIGTFHATCARMLRVQPEPVGRTRDFTILDEEDRRRLLKNLVQEANWDPAVVRPQAVGQLISGWKRRRMGPEAAAGDAALYSFAEERAARLYAKYQRAVDAQDALDFDDLLLKGLELVEWDARGPGRWARQFQHVLVDEYQDTNEPQYLFVKALSAATGNITVCGDPDQSIYRWRGADIRNILQFDRDFPGAAVIRLERNYRSVGNVLKAAQAVIRHNRSRAEKDLVTQREDGPLLQLVEAPDEELEALEVASAVSRWIREGTPAREIAVFYRTNACSRALEAAFTRRQVPYQVVGGLSFFERREIKDLLAYGRLAVNPRDDVAVERVLNVPPRGIGDSTVQRLRAWAAEFEQPLLELMRREPQREALGTRAAKAVASFLALAQQLRERVDSAEIALRTVLDRTGYRRYAEALGDTEDVDRGENIDELLAFAAEYDARQGGGLRGFLEEVALLTDQDRWDEAAQRVSLMTVHTAKGLEFDRVAVIGLEEGLFPHARALEDPDGLEEERRLFYVALTRARLELLLARSRLRFRTGAPGPQAASRFLDEIPPELVEGAGRGELAAWGEQAPVERVREAKPAMAWNGYSSNDRVRHKYFGVGTVLRVLGLGVNQRVVVRFQDDGSERQLLVAYAPMEKLA
ncbi:MAG: ATP-dependent DNA helicase PcrA [Planctomycetota bacterium]|nr:MAG: ATP-dependent DNA helicase PcrA [Planctomycetota bacterium]